MSDNGVRADHVHPAAGEAVYQELILDHYRRPRNHGPLPHADAQVAVKNPLCGDSLELAVRIEGDAIAELRFQGEGCSISQAAASMMAERLSGARVADARVMADRFSAMMEGGAGRGTELADGVDQLGDLKALAGVARLPARVQCAMLPWSALERLLAGR